MALTVCADCRHTCILQSPRAGYRPERCGAAVTVESLSAIIKANNDNVPQHCQAVWRLIPHCVWLLQRRRYTSKYCSTTRHSRAAPAITYIKALMLFKRSSNNRTHWLNRFWRAAETVAVYCQFITAVWQRLLLHTFVTLASFPVSTSVSRTVLSLSYSLTSLLLWRHKSNWPLTLLCGTCVVLEHHGG